MINVLIVDDSVVFRSQISNALGKHTEIRVVGTAANGSIALQKLEQSTVDVVTLDMEMPDMSGIEVLREIRKRKILVKVIFYSSKTRRGADTALLALREGADDVVAKPDHEVSTIDEAVSQIEASLVPKILQFRTTLGAGEPIHPATSVGKEKRFGAKDGIATFSPSVIVMGCSTGGPSALEKVFENFISATEIPILIVQHMPPVFTESLARRLETISGIPTSEGKNDEAVMKNHIYVAPGDYHMRVENKDSSVKIVLDKTAQRNSVRPAVDSLFESAAAVYGRGCLGIVLTGMGEDGLVGAKVIRGSGGKIVIQDRNSCVVFGMPGAIFAENEYDEIGDLDMISNLLRRLAK